MHDGRLPRMMTMHSRSTHAHPEITSYVADSFAPYERRSTDFMQESKRISRAWRTLKISPRENMEENADRPDPAATQRAVRRRQLSAWK
jgi:hypothetical protein